MTKSPSDQSTPSKFSAWEGSSVFVNQGRHWSSAFIWLSASFVAASVAWSFVAKIDQTISVRGKLQPSGSIKDIDSPSSGVVSNVFVKDGVFVSPGDQLLSIESEGLSSRLNSTLLRIKLLELSASSLQSIISSNGDPSKFTPLPSLPTNLDNDNLLFFKSARDQSLQYRSQLQQLSTRLDSKRKSYELQSLIAADLKPLFDSGGLPRNSYLNQLNSLQELKADIATLDSERSRIIGSVIQQLNAFNRELISLKSQKDIYQSLLPIEQLLHQLLGSFLI